MKKALNGMKKLVKNNQPIEDYYKTSDFVVYYDGFLGSKSVRMITTTEGYFYDDNHELVWVTVKDEVLIDFLTKLNVKVFDVKGLFLDNETLAFNVTVIAEMRNKKPINFVYVPYDKRIPNSVVGNELLVSDDLTETFIEYKESRQLFKEQVYLLNKEDRLMVSEMENPMVLSTGLNRQGQPSLILQDNRI